MPTKAPRLNVVLESPVYFTIVKLAKRALTWKQPIYPCSAISHCRWLMLMTVCKVLGRSLNFEVNSEYESALLAFVDDPASHSPLYCFPPNRG